MTYQLRRLRLHGLIERMPNSFRYRVTDLGFRAALFFTRTYNRLLRPGLAAALPALHAIDGPLKRAFDRIDAQVNGMDQPSPTRRTKLDTFTSKCRHSSWASAPFEPEVRQRTRGFWLWRTSGSEH